MKFKGKLSRKAKKQLTIIASKPNYCPPVSKKIECHLCRYFTRCVFTRNQEYIARIYYENHRLSDYLKNEEI